MARSSLWMQFLLALLLSQMVLVKVVYHAPIKNMRLKRHHLQKHSTYMKPLIHRSKNSLKKTKIMSVLRSISNSKLSKIIPKFDFPHKYPKKIYNFKNFKPPKYSPPKSSKQHAPSKLSFKFPHHHLPSFLTKPHPRGPFPSKTRYSLHSIHLPGLKKRHAFSSHFMPHFRPSQMGHMKGGSMGMMDMMAQNAKHIKSGFVIPTASSDPNRQTNLHFKYNQKFPSFKEFQKLQKKNKLKHKAKKARIIHSKVHRSSPKKKLTKIDFKNMKKFPSFKDFQKMTAKGKK